ncbi:protein PAT1 homolog 1-like [Ochlerotatus camptorhynchus]|uniref:protein PAT1 homolog 1-like n=1 Tax=Ochlerotatus camptorhynchus TaxID=644619 RepID=UPI0031D4556E
MNSFFGFDTSLPSVDEQDGFRGDRTGATNGCDHSIDSEGEYDALNDETFGDPDKGDWENTHETLVRLEKGGGFSDGIENGREELFDDDELDLHLSRFDFGDGDESVSSAADLSLDEDIRSRLRLDPSIWDSPVKKQPVQALPPARHEVQSMFPSLPATPMLNEFAGPFGVNFSTTQPPIKMLSVEDIERSIIQKQQQQQEHIKKEKEQQQKILQENQKNKEVKKSIPVPIVNPSIQPLLPSAQLLAIRNQMFPPPPLLNHQSRMPVGFLPYNFLPAHYSTPINNLAMHPGFPAGVGHQFGLFPRIPLPIQPNLIQNIQNNQFNKKLVQEIQQNHPMLSFNRQNQHNNKNLNHQRHSNIPRGSDYDEYANLMSNREKQWLIGIQLTQLNSDAPYISDYYFTVYKERLTALKGNNESKAYKDNQLNHPFTQPKGHAQLLLMSSMARNCGMLHGYNRERKISESWNNEQKDQPPRTYTPLQFENSLGKLQCGSVTAPRKIIDMDVVGNELSNQNNTSLELSMQRKSRHILLHIETLFKVVLKMEDLSNPAAIEAALIVKEKREKERMAQQSDNSSQNVSISSNAEPDTSDELLVVLMSGLTQDKVTLTLGVRKGKILLRRIFVLLREHPSRWTLWSTVFSAIPFLLKKDRDDQEGVLFALYTEFERHVQYSQFLDLLKLSQTIGTEKILTFLTSCKFLLSSVITIIFQMEVLLSKTPDTVTPTDTSKWIDCLELITGIVSKLISTSTPSCNLQHAIKIDRENNIVRTVRVHLERFPQQVKANDFLKFITADPTSNDVTTPSTKK